VSKGILAPVMMYVAFETSEPDHPRSRSIRALFSEARRPVHLKRSGRLERGVAEPRHHLSRAISRTEFMAIITPAAPAPPDATEEIPARKCGK